MIFCDQSSAYDLVNHQKLVVKLFKLLKQADPTTRNQNSVILGYVYRWLCGRKVLFRCDFVVLLAGLPQGSPLSPCIYCLYFDIDIKSGFQLLFADDLIILVFGNSWTQVETSIKKAIAETSNWCSDNDAKLNVKKTKVMCIKRRLQPSKIQDCETVSRHKTLGVTFDQNLNFSAHVAKISQAINRKTAILKMLKYRLNFSTKGLVAMYKCFRSSLIFGTYWIWSLSTSQFRSLETALNKMTKAVFGFIKYTSTSLVYSVTGLPDFEKYVSYWFGLKRYECKTRNRVDNFFDRAIRDRRLSNTNTAQPARVTRPSTRAITRSIASKKCGWHPNVFTWIDKSVHPYQILMSRPKEILDYKRYAKRKFFDTEITKIHQESTLKRIVKSVNDKYSAKFINTPD